MFEYFIIQITFTMFTKKITGNFLLNNMFLLKLSPNKFKSGLFLDKLKNLKQK